MFSRCKDKFQFSARLKIFISFHKYDCVNILNCIIKAEVAHPVERQLPKL
jgi:hypothetical protein